MMVLVMLKQLFSLISVSLLNQTNSSKMSLVMLMQSASLISVSFLNQTTSKRRSPKMVQVRLMEPPTKCMMSFGSSNTATGTGNRQNIRPHDRYIPNQGNFFCWHTINKKGYVALLWRANNVGNTIASLAPIQRLVDLCGVEKSKNRLYRERWYVPLCNIHSISDIDWCISISLLHPSQTWERNPKGLASKVGHLRVVYQHNRWLHCTHIRWIYGRQTINKKSITTLP